MVLLGLFSIFATFDVLLQADSADADHVSDVATLTEIDNFYSCSTFSVIAAVNYFAVFFFCLFCFFLGGTL